MSFKFNEGTENTFSGNVKLYSSVILTWQSIKIRIKSNLESDYEGTNKSEISVKITDGINTYISNTEEIIKGYQGYYVINLADFQTIERTNITLSLTLKNITVYGDTITDEEKMLSGLGAYITSNSMYDCELFVSSDNIWKLDGQNDGYPWIIGNAFYTFKDWSRDDLNYPHNTSVWKINQIQHDGQNDGYPWIIGFKQWNGSNVSVYIKTETGLISCSVFLKTETELKPVLLWRKD